MDAETANGLAGIASLVTSALMLPTIMSLRKIAAKHDDKIEKHDERLDDHEVRLTKVEKAPSKRKRRRPL